MFFHDSMAGIMDRRYKIYQSRQIFGLESGSEIIETGALGLASPGAHHGRRVVMLGHDFNGDVNGLKNYVPKPAVHGCRMSGHVDTQKLEDESKPTSHIQTNALPRLVVHYNLQEYYEAIPKNGKPKYGFKGNHNAGNDAGYNLQAFLCMLVDPHISYHGQLASWAARFQAPPSPGLAIPGAEAEEPATNVNYDPEFFDGMQGPDECESDASSVAVSEPAVSGAMTDEYIDRTLKLNEIAPFPFQDVVLCCMDIEGNEGATERKPKEWSVLTKLPHNHFVPSIIHWHMSQEQRSNSSDGLCGSLPQHYMSQEQRSNSSDGLCESLPQHYMSQEQRSKSLDGLCESLPQH